MIFWKFYLVFKLSLGSPLCSVLILTSLPFPFSLPRGCLGFLSLVLSRLFFTLATFWILISMFLHLIFSLTDSLILHLCSHTSFYTCSLHDVIFPLITATCCLSLWFSDSAVFLMVIKLCFLSVLFQILAVSTHLARILMTLLYKISKKTPFNRVAKASKHCLYDCILNSKLFWFFILCASLSLLLFLWRVLFFLINWTLNGFAQCKLCISV